MSEAAAVVAPFAKVYGEPMLEVPYDLYIPPDALEVFLEQFEGPLDLLLYLIRKENISVLDIPMAKLTVQYLEYVEMMRSGQLELAAEYLLMAAMLIEIKSRMLLPRPPQVSPEEEDPRAELARRLLEYERMKLAGERSTSCRRRGAISRWCRFCSSAARRNTCPMSVPKTCSRRGWDCWPAPTSTSITR